MKRRKIEVGNIVLSEWHSKLDCVHKVKFKNTGLKNKNYKYLIVAENDNNFIMSKYTKIYTSIFNI